MTPWPKWYRPRTTRRVADIITAASRLSGYTVEQIKGQQRQRDLCKVRYAICHIARSRGHSFPFIGRYLGGRDHTTILHGAEQAQVFIQRDRDFADFLDELKLECTKAGASW